MDDAIASPLSFVNSDIGSKKRISMDDVIACRLCFVNRHMFDNFCEVLFMFRKSMLQDFLGGIRAVLAIASMSVKRQDIIWRFFDFILMFWQFNRQLIAFHQLKRLANSNEIFEKMRISSLRVKGIGKNFAFQNISILNAQVCHKVRRKALMESFTATKRDSHWHQQH